MAGGILQGKTMFRIKEAADVVGVPSYVLRFWESEFPWINPERDAGGRRRYTRRNIEDLLVVKSLLHEQRYTIAGAKQALLKARREGGLEDLRRPQREVLRSHNEHALLINLKKELQSLLEMVK